MKNTNTPRTLRRILTGSISAACTIAAIFATQPAHATVYYWDNVVGAGFGTAGGTWAGPTPGPTPGWTTDATGAAVPVSVTTATTDTLNFGDGTTALGGGTITVSGTVGSGNMTFGSANPAAIVLSGGTINLAAATTITVNNAVNNTINSVVTGAATSLTKDGTGTLTLTGGNTYTGVTTLTAGILRGQTTSTSLTPPNPFGSTALQLNGGELNLRANGTLNGSAETIQFNNNVTVGGSATIRVERQATSTNKTIQLGTLSIGAQTLTVIGGNSYILRFNGATTLTGNATFTSTAGPHVTTLAGAIGDGGSGYSLTKTVTGTLILSAANTYSGATTVTGGVLRLDNSLALQNSTLDTAVSAANTLRIGSGVTTLTFGGLSGSKGFDNTFAANTMFQNGYNLVTALTLNPGVGATPSYSGIIGDGAVGMTLTKTGLGTQTLSGPNAYTGATNVTGGTLLIDGSTSTGLVTVGASGTLGGIGAVGGATTVNGTLSPGQSPGAMTFLNTLNLGGATIMEIDGTAGAGVTAGHDFVNLTGAGAAGVLTYGGTMTLDMGVIFGAGSYSWDLFDFASKTGTFSGLNLADQYSGSLLDPDTDGIWDLTSGNDTWQFTESTGVLALNVVPEPTSALLLLGSGALLLLRRRRLADRSNPPL